jgi:hypothetical protein
MVHVGTMVQTELSYSAISCHSADMASINQVLGRNQSDVAAVNALSGADSERRRATKHPCCPARSMGLLKNHKPANHSHHT